MARNRADDPAILPIDPGGPIKPPTIASDPVASAEWDRRVGEIDPAEAGILAAYCSTLSRAERLREEYLTLPGLWIESDSGVVKAHPVVGALNAADRLLGMHAARLGFTPTDRDKVKKKPATAAGKVKKLSRYIK